MKAKSAHFVLSAPTPAAFPPPTLPEVAFAGRSNVGKSSLLNTLVGQTGLARTSSTPGRTRALNWFHVVPPKGPAALHFVDLPGYGYAQVSHAERKAWRPLVEAFAERPTVKLFVVLVDMRRGPEDEERELVEWLATGDVATRVVLTKADKLPKNQRQPAVAACKRLLGLVGSPPLTFSAQTGEGVDELWRAVLATV